MRPETCSIRVTSVILNQLNWWPILAPANQQIKQRRKANNTNIHNDAPVHRSWLEVDAGGEERKDNDDSKI